MTTITFDTLAFVKKLETAGVPPAQAEAQAEALTDILRKVEESRLQELATKGDVLRLEKDIADAKTDMLKWTAGMFAAQTALIIGAMFAMMKMNQPAQPAYTPPHVSQEMRLPSPPPQPPAAQPVR
ncbi:MAG: DUF1640 domain-containing protein [Magnetococcales bacterium]|nr:DUF1640 domain-containing protein [Magnetococcales bacterium]